MRTGMRASGDSSPGADDAIRDYRMQMADTHPTSWSDVTSRRLGHGAVLVAVSIAALVLLGWLIPPLGTRLPHGWDLMKANTAVGILLAAGGVSLAGRPWRERAARLCAALLVLLMVAVLLEHAARSGSRLDTLLAPDAASPQPGLTSAQTALALALFGLALPVVNARSGARLVLADMLVLAYLACLLVFSTGYVFGASQLYGESAAVLVSPHTLVCLLALGTALALRRSGQGVLSVLKGAGIGSRIMRVAIPWALALPLALSLMRAYAVSSGLLAPAYASAVSISFICLCVVLLALLIGRRINGLERELRELMERRSDARLEESQRRYIALVEQGVTGFVVRSASGELMLVNEAYCRMNGYSRDELLHMKASDMVVDQSVMAQVQALKPGESTQIETLMRCKDGSLKDVQYVTQRLQDGNLQSVILDISPRKQAERAREESEFRYAELVEQSLEGIAVRRSDGRLLFVNETLCQMLGYSREELSQLRIQDLVHPDDTETIAQVGLLGPGQNLRLHKRMLRQDGKVLYVEVSAKRLLDGNIQSTFQDVTGRQEAEERFRAIVEGDPNALIMADERGAIVLANPQAERLFGYTREEMVGRSVETLVPMRYHERHPQMREGYNREPQVRAMGAGRDLFGLRKDGTEVPVEIGLNPITTMEGRFVLASIIDISERVRAAKQVRAMEHRYEAAVNALAEGVAVLDAEGRVVAFNKSATKILAMTEDQFAGRTVRDPAWQLQREDGTPFPMEEHPVVITLNTGQERDDVVLVVALPDGSRRVLTVSSRGLDPDAYGKPTSVLASFRDISQQRQHERELRNYAEELRIMSRRLTEAQETERRFIARELHDEVGQALTAARINLKDLQQQAGDSPWALRLAESESLVAELLAKVRQMSLDLHPSVLDDLGLGPALRWCVRTRTTGSDLQVTLRLPDELPRFDDMAEITLFRVFQETLSNVLKHAGAAHLKVQLSYADGRLHLSAKDDGKGFDAEAARRLALSGKSLGLLGMQERVRLAGGEMILESAPGHGAEVRVSLPTRPR